MAEKRKPYLTILLKYEGKNKSNKVELFDSRLFGDYAKRADRYRIRANGKWHPRGEKKFYYPSEVWAVLKRSIKI